MRKKPLLQNKKTKKNKKKIKLASFKQAVRDIIWPRKKLLLVGLILIILGRVASLVLPGATKFFIDNVIPERDFDLLKLLLLVVGAATAVQATSSYFLARLLSVEAQRLIADLRLNVQKHIIRLPIKFFDQNKSGELVSRIMNDVEGVRNLVGTGFVQLIGGLLTAILALIILLSIHAVMTVISLVFLLSFGFVLMKAFSYMRPAFRMRSAITARVTGRLTEMLGGIRIVKGFFKEADETKTFSKGVDDIFLNVKKTLTVQALVTMMGTILMGVIAIVMISLGGYFIIQEVLTIGDFFAYTMYLGLLIAPIFQISNIGTQITDAFAGLDRMEEIFNYQQEGQDKNRTYALAKKNHSIVFEKVRFYYDKDKEVLTNINFQVAPGEVVALVGASGSGKTTIANLAASFLTPTQGRVLVDGIDMKTVSLESYRSQLGVVLQNDFLFDGTIRANILYTKPSATKQEFDKAVRYAYVDEFANKFKKKLNTIIGERGVKLSGGQCQRISIARAILASPNILILDEATSNLDNESEYYIQKSLKKLLKGRTTFVIAHRLSTIQNADNILVIEDGKIKEQGKHHDLINKRGRYYQLYTYQARI